MKTVRAIIESFLFMVVIGYLELIYRNTGGLLPLPKWCVCIPLAIWAGIKIYEANKPNKQ